MDPIDKAKQKKDITLKDSGGIYSQLNKNDILQTMDLTYPGWREKEKTFVFPIIAEPVFEGPLTDVTSDYDKGLVKGFHSEVDVLWALKKVSQENSLGLRIFYGISITKPMLEATASAFETIVPEYKDNLVTTGCGSENCKQKISAKSKICKQTTKFVVIFHDRSLMMYFKPNLDAKNPN